MNKLLFATGNIRKLGEAKLSCDLFGIDVEQVQLDIDEIQSHDPLVISKHKAESAYRLTNRPVVINDAFWSIPALNGFPGGYMKDVMHWFVPEDFLALMRNKQDRSVIITDCVIYKDSKTLKVFTQEITGIISIEPKGDGNSIEQLTIIDNLTIAEHHNLGQFSQKPEDQVWYDFAKWFSEYN